MSFSGSVLSALAIGIAAACIAIAQADDPNTRAPASEPPPNVGSQATSKPDPYAPLRAMVGDWDMEATFTTAPGAKPISTKARMRNTMILGGLFLESRSTGGSLETRAGPRPLETLSLTGFDAAAKQYTVTRFSSTVPVPMAEAGPFDIAKGTLTTTGEFSLGGMKLKVRTLLIVTGADEHKVEQYMSFNDAPEFKGVEMNFKRRHE